MKHSARKLKQHIEPPPSTPGQVCNPSPTDTDTITNNRNTERVDTMKTQTLTPSPLHTTNTTPPPACRIAAPPSGRFYVEMFETWECAPFDILGPLTMAQAIAHRAPPYLTVAVDYGNAAPITRRPCDAKTPHGVWIEGYDDQGGLWSPNSNLYAADRSAAAPSAEECTPALPPYRGACNLDEHGNDPDGRPCM